MEVSAQSIKCPNCGAPQAMTDKECKYCHSPVIITTFTSVESMSLPLLNKYVGAYQSRIDSNGSDASANMSIGICFLKLKNYYRALLSFEKAMESIFDSSDLYFYAAIAVFEGRKPYCCNRKQIDKAEMYLDAALSIDNRPIYLYFKAYIRLDYYFRNYFNISPSYSDLLAQVVAAGGVSETDKQNLFELLRVEVPDDM